MKITALAGGVGASKFLAGLCRSLPGADLDELTIIVNTGDDIEMFGLYIAPDIDIVTYTLSGKVNTATGWGLPNESFNCLEQLLEYHGESRWFNLGDRDLATHIYRTELMRQGISLTEITDRLRRRHGLTCRIVPMTDSHVPTTILTAGGPLHFQEYLIRQRAEPRVEGIRFENIEQAQPAAGVLEAIAGADGVIICPSNPLISIGPILAVPGVRAAMTATSATVLAISPVVGGASLKGPTDRMLSDLGMEVSAHQVARIYADLLDIYVMDERDVESVPAIEEMGMRVATTQTIMSGDAEKESLARSVIALLS